MKGFSINPHTRVIAEFDTGSEPLLPALRAAIGCEHLESVLLAPGVLMWADARGGAQPGQAWWRFTNGAQPIAGTAVFSGVDHDGMPSDYTAQPALEDVGRGIEFLQSVKARVVEMLRVEMTNRGPWPRVYHDLVIEEVVPLSGVPDPDPAAPEAPAEPEYEDRQAMFDAGKIRHCWVVTKTDSGFVGTEYAVSSDSPLAPTGAVLTAPSLDELSDEIPPDCIFFERSENDAPEVVGTWI